MISGIGPEPINGKVGGIQPQLFNGNACENCEQSDDVEILDCYKQLSTRDVPMMKGDRGPRLKRSYKRWDKDLEIWDDRQKGSLPLMRRDTKCGTLAEKYREFSSLPMDMSLGTVRNIFGAIGISALRTALRNGVVIE